MPLSFTCMQVWFSNEEEKGVAPLEKEGGGADIRLKLKNDRFIMEYVLPNKVHCPELVSHGH